MLHLKIGGQIIFLSQLSKLQQHHRNNKGYVNKNNRNIVQHDNKILKFIIFNLETHV